MSNQGALPSQTQQAQGQSGQYRVYIPQLDTASPDPLDPQKRYHEGIFVETDPDGRGTLFHVTGDIIAFGGMRYEERSEYRPRESAHYHNIINIGWVLRDDFHKGRIGAILQNLPKPPKQQGPSFKPDPITGRCPMIWTKPNGEAYEPGEQRRPIIKCN
ncbi:hypothetical protein ACJ73_09294 [Blastomyces percursus]|uniref:Uncharacterized protein n=1 Tax=Blastomyces percursus TaxID=1658174 RepID=A0A1J9P9R7_9EURO|nr:hypothetical protein ACJ73_09294 [Blastomyces percursus]